MGKMIKFEHVNEHGDFEKVLQHFNIEYTRNRDQIRCLCPLHDDTNPSLSITLVAIPEKNVKANTWQCFGCKESGTIIDLTAALLGSDLRTAAELVADVSGCGLAPARSGPAKGGRTGRTKPTAANASKAKTKENATSSGSAKQSDESSEDVVITHQPLKFTLPLEQAHPYIEERVPLWLAHQFGVGVCSAESRSMMAGRCCVPIHDPAGALIAYAGRYLGDDPAEPKWKLPPRFNKLNVVFNGHRIEYCRKVVLVEGFFDVIRLHGLCIPAVSCMGTAISELQVKILVDLGIEQVLVLFDGDEEGQAAVPDAVTALASSVYVRSAELPVGSDPANAPEATLRQLASL